MSGIVQRVKSKVVLEHANGEVNEDLLPSPPDTRNWTWMNYSSLWAGQALDATWWSVGSSFVSVGLTVDQTICPVIIGSALTGIAAVLNATFGAYYYVGFPAMIRSTFGIRGSKWFVALRGIVGIIWYAVQTYYMGNLMNIMWLCMFGHKYRDWNPTMPASAGTDAKTVLNYFLAWGVALPLALLHPSKLRPIFIWRVIFAFASFFSMFVWCTVIGQRDPKGFKGFSILQEVPISRSELGWATMKGINAILATVAPMITNQSDISRYAKSPKQAGWPMGISVFVSKAVMAFFSIISAASLQSRYGGTAKWSIWEQLQVLLDENWDGKTRFGCFMISVGVCYSIMVTNAYCNSVPFGADIAALFPRYFNMVRGQVFITLVSLPVLPWQILSNATQFLTFLGSYTFLMGALLGCQWGDFILRKGNYHVPSMFDMSPGALYMYSKGYNWRGFAGWFVSFAVIFPGLIAAYIPDKMSVGAERIYSMGWIISVTLSGFCYYAINRFFPVPVVPPKYQGAAEESKWLGMGAIEGIFPGETIEGMATTSDDESSMAEDDKKDPVAVYAVAA